MTSQQHNEEYLFFHTVETFYDTQKYTISYEEFMTKLSDNERVSADKMEIKLLYNNDRTKLKLVVFKQNKSFVELKNAKLKRVVPRKCRTYTGFTIDLIKKNIYTYVIVHNLKKRTKIKTIRCNIFFHHFFGVLDNITLSCFNERKELVEILCNHLQLKPDCYATASDILSAYFLCSRNIEYYSANNLKYFMPLFQTYRKKYFNTDIYCITQDTLRINDISYVKLFYEQKLCNAMFYYMVMFDLFKMNHLELNSVSNFIDIEKNISFGKIDCIRFFFNKLNNIYFFKYPDFVNSDKINEYLQTLNHFNTYGYKVNIEKVKTIDKINNILKIILYKMMIVICEEGYVFYNTKSIDIISKHLGSDYTVNYQMYPKGYIDMLDKGTITEDGILAFNLTRYTVQRFDGVTRDFFFDQNYPQILKLSGKSLTFVETKSKIGVLLSKYSKSFEEYNNMFSSTICFSEQRLVSLCQEDDDKINAYKYITKL